MSDTIKTTIKTTMELNGITMMHPDDRGLIKISRTENCACTYNYNLVQASFERSMFSDEFYIECTDDPSKLHKFCEMKYLGLVDNPHYKGVGDLLSETIKRFDGCVVLFNSDGALLVAKKNLFRLGCESGVRSILERVSTRMTSHAFYPIRDMMVPSFFLIDASKIPNTWILPSHDEERIRITCEQLKDIEP